MGQDSDGRDNISLDRIADFATNWVTLGTVGVQNGKFKQGTLARLTDEAIGEVSGRNASREANANARAVNESEKQAKQLELQNEQKRKEQLDISASKAAAAVRASTNAQQQNALGSSTNPARDFLGL